MLYEGLHFASEAKKTVFYSNFVATIDGKVQVLTRTNEYWPLGSEFDYETFIELRTYADVLIHGSTTALAHPTLISLSKDEFHKARHKIKKDRILYIVISNHPSVELLAKLTSQHSLVATMVITSEKAVVPKSLAEAIEIVRLGKNEVAINLLPDFLEKLGKKHVLVEGGPTLMGSFFRAKLLDEIFLTITPKIIGNKNSETLSMVEGFLYPPTEVPSYELISCQPIKSEVYLRYRRKL